MLLCESLASPGTGTITPWRDVHQSLSSSWFDLVFTNDSSLELFFSCDFSFCCVKWKMKMKQFWKILSLFVYHEKGEHLVFSEGKIQWPNDTLSTHYSSNRISLRVLYSAVHVTGERVTEGSWWQRWLTVSKLDRWCMSFSRHCQEKKRKTCS